MQTSVSLKYLVLRVSIEKESNVSVIIYKLSYGQSKIIYVPFNNSVYVNIPVQPFRLYSLNELRKSIFHHEMI